MKNVGKGLKRYFDEPMHTFSVVAQLYSNAAVNFSLNGINSVGISYVAVMTAAMLYSGENSRSPFLWALRKSDAIFKKPSQASERLKNIFEGVLEAKGLDKETYNISSYKKGHLSRVFNRGKQVYIGPAIENALSDEELRFIIAHALSHVENDDFAFPSLTNAAYYASFANIFAAITKTATDAPTSLPEIIGLFAAPSVWAAHDYLRNKLFSEINLRADAAALSVTNDRFAAWGALHKLRVLEKSQSLSQRIMDSLVSAHPENLEDRICALEMA